MTGEEYICLACGSYYQTAPSSTHDCDEKKCPKCFSSNVMKLNVSKLFGFAGGGG
ncbi:MAG TPA: hypothetical protein VEI96_05300 [Thermodesulfovibrionales bacterium]|nr:hypothetical protein [Thermodesulfovibrionales bacterium]